MNRYLIIFFAFMLAMSSAFSEIRPVLEIDFQPQETLDSIPAWSNGNFILTTPKKSSEIRFFDQEDHSLIPTFDKQVTSHQQLYYLPIYSLVRQKEYFLLI